MKAFCRNACRLNLQICRGRWNVFKQLSCYICFSMALNKIANKTSVLPAITFTQIVTANVFICKQNIHSSKNNKRNSLDSTPPHNFNYFEIQALSQRRLRRTLTSQLQTLPDSYSEDF